MEKKYYIRSVIDGYARMEHDQVDIDEAFYYISRVWGYNGSKTVLRATLETLESGGASIIIREVSWSYLEVWVD